MSRSPYKLFDYYTFADRDLFFGREREVMRTVGEIISNRLLVLFAPSGSGKSSLINAGVRPALEKEGFLTATVRLDCAPDQAIKRQLRKKQEEKELPECFAALKDDTDLLAGLRAAYAPKDGQPVPKPLVLFLDQFEEFFIVFQSQPAVRRTFIKQVAQIKFDTGLPVYLVLSLRDDYFVNLNEFRKEIPSIRNADVQLWPLSDEAALRAIVEPARIVGLQFEAGLPEQIIQDLKAVQLGPARALEDGVLPITLQIVCHVLWSKCKESGLLVTNRLYTQLGGVSAIIRDQFRDSLSQVPLSQHGLMRRLFRCLITPGLTKRLRTLDDLAEACHVRDPRELRLLLNKLTKAEVLRVEYHDKQEWFEFRHDFLTTEAFEWLKQFEARLRLRRQAITVGLAVVPTIILTALSLWNFLSLEVRFTPKQYEAQEEELYLTRRFDPFGFEVTTGFRKGEVTDYENRNAVAKGYPLQFAESKKWIRMTNLLSGEALGRLLSEGFGDRDGLRETLTTDLGRCVRMARIDPGVSGDILALLKDSDSDVRHSAAAALGQLGKADAPVVVGLVALLKDSSSYVRQRAAEALGQLGKADAPVVAGLVALLKDSDSDVRQSAAAALGQLGKADAPVVAGLVALLKDSDSDVRQSAAAALGQLGKADAPVVECLVALLKDSDLDVRLHAAEALGRLGQADAPVVAGLLALLQDNDPDVRQRAAAALVGLGKADPPVVQSLLAMLKENDSEARLIAAAALGQLGQADPPVVQSLLAMLKENNSEARLIAAAALGQLGQADALVIHSLLAVLKDSDAETRINAAEALGNLGKADAPVVGGLLALLKDSDSDVRQSAAEALGKLGQQRRDWTDERLLKMLQDNLSGWRQTAGLVLANRTNLTPATYDQVMTLRLDSRPWVRLAAWDALLEIQKVRDAREQAAKAAQPVPPAQPPQ